MRILVLSFLILLTHASEASLVNFSKRSNFYVYSGCRIFNNFQAEVRVLPGDRCVFFDNGEYLSATTTALRLFGANNELKWEVKGHYHHQMNLSHDKQRLLVLSSSVQRMGEDVPKRFDKFIIYDLAGKVLHEAESVALLTLANSHPNTMVNNWPNEFPGIPHEGSHFNSMYEIPPLRPGLKLPSYIAAGNIIVNSTKQGVLVLDPTMTKVLHSRVFSSSLDHTVHDVQVSADGKMIYFNNLVIDGANGSRYSRIEEVDLTTNKMETVFQASPRELFFSKVCGGVQNLDQEHVLISHHVAGFYVYSRKQKAVVYATDTPYWQGNRFVPVQQIYSQDLTSFLANNK